MKIPIAESCTYNILLGLVFKTQLNAEDNAMHMIKIIYDHDCEEVMFCYSLQHNFFNIAI